jgi:hypothetical protein
MESGLECEGDVEGAMDEMALREERDGVGQWQPWCTQPRQAAPSLASGPLGWPAKQ